MIRLQPVWFAGWYFRFSITVTVLSTDRALAAMICAFNSWTCYGISQADKLPPVICDTKNYLFSDLVHHLFVALHTPPFL